MFEARSSTSVPIGVAIVGAGAFGRVHADALTRRTDAYLVGVVGQTGATRDAFAADFGVTAFGNLEAMCADERVDAVVIATPHDTHADIAVPCLAAGRHVLIEKPLAHTAAAGDAIVKAAAASGAVCMVGHVMRYAPAHVAAAEILRSGEIGEIVHVDSRSVIDWSFDRRQPWHTSAAAGGGMWLTQGTHVIDRVSWLVGEQAARVCGIGRTAFHDGRQDADDFGAVLLSFPSGVTAQLTVAGFTHGVTDVGTLVHGTRGQLRLSHRGDLAVGRNDRWEPREVAVVDGWREAMMQGEWSAFLEGVRSGTSPIPADYGRYVLAVALKAIAGAGGEAVA